VEENSAAYGRKITERIIDIATREPYSFLWINLRATDRSDLFWKRFEVRLVVR
jgi:hypothetical protein